MLSFPFLSIPNSTAGRCTSLPLLCASVHSFLFLFPTSTQPLVGAGDSGFDGTVRNHIYVLCRLRAQSSFVAGHGRHQRDEAVRGLFVARVLYSNRVPFVQVSDIFRLIRLGRQNRVRATCVLPGAALKSTLRTSALFSGSSRCTRRPLRVISAFRLTLRLRFSGGVWCVA